MSLAIPNDGIGLSTNQSIIFSTDLEILSGGISGRNCVHSGCLVTATTLLTLNVAAGSISSADTIFTIGAATVVIGAADATNPRIDYVVITSAGAKAVRAGTAAANPKPPALTADDVGLAIIYIPALATTLTSVNIYDRRIVTQDVPLPSATPAIVLGTAAASGSEITYLRSDATIVANRAALPADARGWTFLGQATASTAIRTGTITWTGTYKQLMFEYHISGYSNTAIGRLIVGPTAGLSETGTTFCCSHGTGVSAITTSVSIPGWPTFGGAADNVPRWGWGMIKNVATEVKRMDATGMNGGTAPTTAPTTYKMNGLFNDTTNLINKAELAVYDAITGTAISTRTFNAGTYLNFWGRNDD